MQSKYQLLDMNLSLSNDETPYNTYKFQPCN